MRHIELSTDPAFDEVQVLRSLIENAEPSRPYTVAKIRLALRVLDKLQPGPVDLEEDEWAFVRERVGETQWMRATPLIVAFVDRIENAKPASVAQAA